MFDTTLLPPALLSFAVVTDTHYMLEMAGRKVEFESRLKQTDRAEVALKQIATLNPPFLIHIGDIAQEYPETERYLQAITEAKAQLDRCGVPRYHAPGNQDVGDKPDPTTPGLPVTEEALRVWHEHFGPSWQSFDADGNVHIVLMNSQILNNNDLPQTAEQRQWLEHDLARAHADGKRIFLFLHLPLYLRSPDEPHLGHYDNVGQPDRAWVVDLIRRHEIELVMSGHVHFPFFNRIGRSRYFVSQATSFTRPGFSHMFSSPPPPEQGRDQAPLLGFHLARVMPHRTDLHLVRTSGETALPEPLTQGWQRVLTRTPAAIAENGLGVTLRHPLAWTSQVPTAWPSAVRQVVRNDLPLLALLELGAGHVRVPLMDLEDPEQAERLQILRDEGVRVVAIAVAEDETLTVERLKRAAAQADELELATLSSELEPRAIALLRACHEAGLAPLNLASIVSRQPVPGKQHPRTRHGYLPSQWQALSLQIERAGLPAGRVLFRLDGGSPSSDWMSTLCDQGGVDLALEFRHGDTSPRATQQQVTTVVHTMLSAAQLPDARLYLEPLIDMDRTMDICPGLLDTQCNPRPIFHAVRCVNSILASGRTARLLGTDVGRHFTDGPRRIYRLEQALVRTCEAADAAMLDGLYEAGETLLLEEPQ